MRLFLDCEWADEQGCDLVSLGLVSEDGHHRFYAEVSPLPQEPNDFVRRTASPLGARFRRATEAGLYL